MSVRLTTIKLLATMSKPYRSWLAKNFTTSTGMARAWFRFLGGGGDIFIEAREQGVTVGVAGLFGYAGQLVFSVYVKRAHRRRGIGTKMVRALRKAAAIRWPGVELVFIPPTAGAAAFFESVGE